MEGHYRIPIELAAAEEDQIEEEESLNSPGSVPLATASSPNNSNRAAHVEIHRESYDNPTVYS